MLDLSGHELGRYRILSLLGRGGMATVYRASDAKMGRDVAVKVLPPEMALGGAHLARFEREAKAIAALDHPFIVPVFDFGEEDGFSYMVMPLIAGGSLDARIEAARSAGRFLPLVEVGRILGEVSSALSYAHERGLVHRDLKPSNVLIDDEGRCRLADFGIARMLNETTKITQSGVVMGTPRYMSPEQALGGAIDERTDIYSLGVMLFELLTNAAPFEAEGALAILLKHAHEPVPLPRSRRPELPESTEKVVLKALKKDPAERWQEARAMATAFNLSLRRVPDGEVATVLDGPTVVIGAAKANGGQESEAPGPGRSSRGTNHGLPLRPRILALAAVVVFTLILGYGFRGALGWSDGGESPGPMSEQGGQEAEPIGADANRQRYRPHISETGDDGAAVASPAEDKDRGPEEVVVSQPPGADRRDDYPEEPSGTRGNGDDSATFSPPPSRKDLGSPGEVETQGAERQVPPDEIVFGIQVFSSRDRALVEQAASRLDAAGFRTFIASYDGGGFSGFRVRLGPYESREAAEQEAVAVQRKLKYDTWITRLPAQELGTPYGWNAGIGTSSP